MITLKTPYLLFTGDAQNRVNAKTATGIADFKPENCLGYYGLPEATLELDNLPKLSIKDAAAQGAKTFVIGLANSGGFIADNWVPAILEAIELGLDIASGLHKKLEDVPEIKNAAEKHGVSLHNVRHCTTELVTGSGNKRTGKRILTVGTDCSVGKMYTALVTEKALNNAGKKAHFVATGQTGILVAGSGIAIDAVISDFISGAVEMISPDIPEDEFQVIEGQGSLFHPSFAGVSLGLLHGSSADYIIMCHDPSREHMRHLPDYPVVSLKECIERNILMGSLTNPNIKCLGIACNTSSMPEADAKAYLEKISNELNLPATDPFRFGAESLITELC